MFPSFHLRCSLHELDICIKSRRPQKLPHYLQYIQQDKIVQQACWELCNDSACLLEIPIISEKDVIEALEEIKVNNAERQNDIPAKILKHFSKFLSKPLARIYAITIKQGCSPKFLKIEVVTPIPKVSPVKDIDDLRKITSLMNLDPTRRSIKSIKHEKAKNLFPFNHSTSRKAEKLRKKIRQLICLILWLKGIIQRGNRHSELLITDRLTDGLIIADINNG